ncbi:hypothetical protein ASE17_10140 [Phenylobacterium sp. Root77]|jgi:hypothetical protein|uniref:hypothetical protein n=1 Tax=unclassified Phenylobacterium TaxID=2640670 RepID=UPI0006FA5D26|nr:MULTISPECIES: hypothetical protein [unclassified Phenylobacterium]KQW73282.1 hypothetical protein ASC73_02710 [Phenylobacterium sp. Root1277]KQW92502.1 hypothetical protein ASC79_13420 [Phenylobacterium sp. Root1290]KRC40731.1 hypothetical protein ASE17_10140 [Phenylobacterium sp. Root77]
MPAAARVTPFRRSYADPLFLFEARRPLVPASADMIDQVITHADVAVRQSGGRLKLRLTAGMIEQLQHEGKLGEDAHRLADLTVIWDEIEGQVHTVRDDARLRDAADRWADWDALFDEESFRPVSAAA